MQKVIGLDIGSYSIKAVEIINSFNSYKISNFYEQILPYDPSVPMEQKVVPCMEKLFSTNNLQADRIVSAMPGQYTATRILTFSFSDTRKIAAAIPFEMEDLVPFNLDDMLIEHQIIGPQNNQTCVLVVMVQKNFMRQYLDQLAQMGIDPRLVDVDSLSFYNLSPHIASVSEDELYGIVDIGHEKTSICLIQGTMLRMFRTLKIGGKYITEVLARDLEISYLEAQELKHKVSAIVSNKSGPKIKLSPYEKDIAQRIGMAAHGFSTELSRTLHAFKDLEQEQLSKIYISGGTTQLRGIESYLEHQLSTPVEHHDITLDALQMEPALKKFGKITPQALSIGLRVVTGASKRSSINLRKNEFAYSHDSESLLKTISRLFKWAGVGCLLLIAGYTAQHVFYHYQIHKFETRYRQKLLSIEPSQATSISSLNSFEALQQFAKQNLEQSVIITRQTINNFHIAGAGSTPLHVLALLSQIIPQDIAVEIVLYDYKTADDFTGKLTLQGETDGYGSVEKIKELITGHTSFENVTEKNSDSKPGSDGKIITFTLLADFIPDAVAQNPDSPSHQDPP